MKVRLSWVSLSMLIFLLSNAEGADLRLATDHFSRTITAKDTAIYWIEIVSDNAKDTLVSLSVRLNPALNFHLSKDQATPPELVRLKVYTQDENHTGKDTLFIRASGVSGVTTLQVWLNVVIATVDSPKLVLDAPPTGVLEKNILQSLEGAIVPAKKGSIKVFLRSPSSKQDTLSTSVDEMGLFHVNHIFKERGQWRAFASWQATVETDGPSSVSSDSAFFQVKPRPVRLTVSAEGFRHDPQIPDTLRVVPDSLRVVGQIATDFLSRTTISLQVMNPDSQAVPVVGFQLDSTTGKFWANFPTGKKTGIYRIKARAQTENSFGSLKDVLGEFQYASIAPSSFHLFSPMADNGNGDSEADSEVPLEVPGGYAVIVVGHSIHYEGHYDMANRLRDELIFHRGIRPNDILLETLHQNPPGGSGYKNSTNLGVAINDSLTNKVMDTDFPHHRGLLFFWIGHTNANNRRFNAGGASTLSAQDIGNIYTSALNQMHNGQSHWSHFNVIIFMHAGDNSGMLLDNLRNILTPPSATATDYYMISSLGTSADTEDYLTLCGLNTFANYFLQATVANRRVLSSFKFGWEETSEQPRIDHDMDQTFDSETVINDFGTATGPTEPRVGYGINYGDIKPAPKSTLTASIVGSPQLDSDGTVWVAIDNPNRYPIRQVTLIIEPPKEVTDQPVQCFELIPVDSLSLWNARVDVYKDKGVYRGKIFAQYEDPAGRLDFAFTSFERFRHFVPVPSTQVTDIAVIPSSHNYGTVEVGSSVPQTFVVNNEGTADLVVSSTNLTGSHPSEFTIVSGGGNFTLAPGATRNIVVSFNPISVGAKSAALSIANNDPDEGLFNVVLTCNGVSSVPDIVVNPISHNYGNVQVGSSAATSFLVKNEGTADLLVSSTNLSSQPPGEFAIVSGGDNFTLAPGATRDIVVSFNPTSAGAESAALSIASNDPDEDTVVVNLTGNGVQQQPGEILVDLGPGSLLGVDRSVNDSNLRLGVGMNIFKLSRGETTYLKLPLISFSGDKDVQWGTFSPAAVNIGNLLLGGKILSDLWLHAGVGYVIRDKRTPSNKGDFIVVGGLRTGL